MNEEVIQKMLYNCKGDKVVHPLAMPLKESLQLISNFFTNNSNNKLCLVFPVKEFAAQWIAIPSALFLIESDFDQFKNEILETLNKYKKGDRLILNNDAIVEWNGRNTNGFVFKHKEYNSVDEITINVKKISKIQPAPSNRKALSSYSKVVEAINKKNVNPTDRLLGIQTEGNKLFNKNSICLISKHIAFGNSVSEILINDFLIEEYFKLGKIDDSGQASNKSPLFISNNLSNLALYVTLSESISKIIIDGFSAIRERGTDFSDIDVKNIPTILITDLSEIEHFETIADYGFEFFNFTKENLVLDNPTENSPFNFLNKKLEKYKSFHIVKNISENSELEAIVKKIHSIQKDDSNNDLISLKISLIQLINSLSRVVHVLEPNEISGFKAKIDSIETFFNRSKMWLGDSKQLIEESISLLKSVIKKFTENPSEKCSRLEELIRKKQYDYIICPTEEETKSLKNFFRNSYHSNYPSIISIADVNDNLISSKPLKAILTGWAKSNNINRILSCFLFSELTFLFYQFENRYYNSLQKRNKVHSEKVNSTVNVKGLPSRNEAIKSRSFAALYSNDTIDDPSSEDLIDIVNFELRLDNAQYSKYYAKGNIIESIKAKRIDFENSYFIYTNESHKFLVINEYFDKKIEHANLYRKKIEGLKTGDIIAVINTDRDILVELVEKHTKPEVLSSLKQWTNLWKNLLRDHYASTGNDFKRLVKDLRKYDCIKHEVTIKTWLQDEARIGPDDDADLISIALLTNSELLNDNIKRVRESITKMKGLRHDASEFIINKIKAQIYTLADSSIINTKVTIEGLGSVFILKVVEVSNSFENIDVKYVNRLLEKEII
ncbi:DrmE family protein [Flavobacterium sp. N1719]|uniref:DrmE family protein n=1 Tax=Flavobacterium sp. N1719 TaxID=2885633 RepID=UPI002222A651|nr:DrmE family protein [Flavobacterium sp. N1719]